MGRKKQKVIPGQISLLSLMDSNAAVKEKAPDKRNALPESSSLIGLVDSITRRGTHDNAKGIEPPTPLKAEIVPKEAAYADKPANDNPVDGEIINFFDYFNIQSGTEHTEEKDVPENDVKQPDNEKSAPVVEHAAEKPKETTLSVPAQKKYDYRITDETPEAISDRDKFRNNIKAIGLLKGVEAQHRLATPAEQKNLAGYCGWGGLPIAFDVKNTAWADEYKELKDILSEDEYQSAMDSVLNAHYTPPTVIKAVYSALSRLGLKCGNILEPACGTGRFFGLLPDGMKASRLYGVELDCLTGRIAKQLYQTAHIHVTGFESTAFSDNFFDAAISNVPFGDYGVSDVRYDKLNLRIHDYFFVKALDLVRPGGIIAFITSKGTLDKESGRVRKYIAQRAGLIGAIRLPNNAFKSAGTKVTADIIFLQKRESMTDGDDSWVSLGSTDAGIPVNSYFSEHPDMMLGHMEYTTRFGEKSGTELLFNDGTDLQTLLSDAVNKLPSDITAEQPKEAEKSGNTDMDKEEIPADPDVKNFTYTVKNGRIYYRNNSVMSLCKLGKIVSHRVSGLISVRNAVRNVIDTQV